MGNLVQADYEYWLYDMVCFRPWRGGGHELWMMAAYSNETGRLEWMWAITLEKFYEIHPNAPHLSARLASLDWR